jgi:hypothetical protein
VTRDQLVGHVVEIIADDLRLRADAQDIVADAFDEGSFPTGRDRAKRVPGVTGDQAEARSTGRPSSFST